MTAMRTVARVRSDFPTRFGIPRQGGLVPELSARVVFEPEFRDPHAVRGLDGFSHIWLLWAFSGGGWSSTVRPPRLRGNRRMGVFATRSPYRPNPIGLSAVRLERVELHARLGPVLWVRGADLMDGTGIYDIKPYLPGDAHPDAAPGFTAEGAGYALAVDDPDGLLSAFDDDRRAGLVGALAQDPRPPYHRDPDRVYGLAFAGNDVRFTVGEGRLRVRAVVPLRGGVDGSGISAGDPARDARQRVRDAASPGSLAGGTCPQGGGAAGEDGVAWRA